MNMSQIFARREAKSHAVQDHWIAEKIFNWSGVVAVGSEPELWSAKEHTLPCTREQFDMSVGLRTSEG